VSGAREPAVVGFLCSWCSYAGADKAGLAQRPLPASVRFVRVMCTGRVEPAFVLEAFRRGADGVMVLACHPGDCHYKEGNIRSLQRARLLRRLLAPLGVDPARVCYDYVSAGEDERLAGLAWEFVARLRGLGPRAGNTAAGVPPPENALGG
jgi:coenzyme F420-reducing hydrogenase delta subunit